MTLSEAIERINGIYTQHTWIGSGLVATRYVIKHLNNTIKSLRARNNRRES